MSSLSHELDFEGELESVNNLHDLVEYVSNKLQCPVTVETTDFNLMSYSGNPEILDSARRDTILGKRVPTIIVQKLKKDGILQLIYDSEVPIRVESIDSIGLSERVVISIKDRNRVLGCFWVQETERKLTEKDLSLLTVAAKQAARHILKKLKTKQEETKVKVCLLTKLIQGAYSSEQELRQEAELANIHLPAIYSIVVFSSESSELFFEVKKLMQPYNLYSNKIMYWIELENRIVVLLGSLSAVGGASEILPQQLVDSVLGKFDEDSKKRIKAGISAESNHILKMEKGYREAVEVINLKTSFQNVPLCFSELGIFRFLPMIQTKYKADGYINQNIQQLKDYDSRHQTVLLRTLEAYIQFNCKVRETSEALFIHPNTLNYRLKRIQDLSQINLEDFDQRVLLYVDLLLEKYEY